MPSISCAEVDGLFQRKSPWLATAASFSRIISGGKVLTASRRLKGKTLVSFASYAPPLSITRRMLTSSFTLRNVSAASLRYHPLKVASLLYAPWEIQFRLDQEWISYCRARRSTVLQRVSTSTTHVQAHTYTCTRVLSARRLTVLQCRLSRTTVVRYSASVL